MTTRSTVSNPATRWLRACYWKTYSLLALLLVALLAPPPVFGYTVPNTADLLFGFNTASFPASGATGAWARSDPAGGTFATMATPMVDNVGVTPVKWEKQDYATGTGYNGGTQAAAIPIVGATVVAVIKPVRRGVPDNWQSIVDVLYDQFCLVINQSTGQLGMKRGTGDGTGSTTQWGPAGTIIPDGQSTVVSTVMAADGSWKMYINGTLQWTFTTTTTLTKFFRSGLNTWGLGRNTFDGWTVYNGNLGDIMVWKIALDDTSRAALETDLMAKFHAGASYPASTISPSTSGGGGTITPAAATSVPYEADQTFTITKNVGYARNVIVDGVSQGDIATYTFNDVIAAHTITVDYTALPYQTVSGNVSPAGATVSFKGTPDSLAAFTATADPGTGNFSISIPQGTYYVCASKTGYMISADSIVPITADTTGVNFTLVAGRSIPMMEKLLFAADSSSLGAIGTTGNWPLLYNTYPGASMLGGLLTAYNTPMVAKVRGIKYDNNLRLDNDGYRLNPTVTTTPIPTTGASIIAVVKPVRNTLSDTADIIAHAFFPCLALTSWNGGTNAGKVRIYRNNLTYDSTNVIPDGQLTILSLVVQPDGQFKVWASAWSGITNTFGAATLFMSSTVTSSFTAFTPVMGGTDDFRKRIGVGGRDGNGNYAYNGYIGDTFIYKTALSDADRAILEADINTKTTSVTAYNITSTAGANGSISPLGVTGVAETDSQTYTITPAFGYDVGDVSVTENGVTSSKGAVTTYTFTNVTAVGSISTTFVNKPTYAVSGTVTRVSDGSPLAGATVYVSTTANASVSPLFTATADASGNYSLPLFNATWYLCASASGLTTSADTTVTMSGAAQSGINFALAASGKNIPLMDQLLFAAYGTALTANGATTNPWPLEHPKGKTAVVQGTPVLTTVDGLQWEQNRYASGDGYRVGTYTTPITIAGLTATAVVQPLVSPTGGNQWSSVIDVMYSRFILCVRGVDGMIRVCRNGEWKDGPTLPNGQKTILTAVVQADGKYKVFANGIQVMDITTTSPMTSLDPKWNGGTTGFWSSINIGRNDPDGWTTYQGNIGAAFLWKTTLTQGERIGFESELGTTFGITLPVYHNITASAGTGGTISPSGVVPVLAGTDQAFTIAANVGYRIQNVIADGEPLGATSTYTFPAVTGIHTITATFAVVPQWTVTGKVTSKSNAAIEGAKVYFSLTPNAKLAPVYTAVTNNDGMYSQVVYEGALYVAADATNYYTSADTVLDVTADTPGVDFALSSTVRDIPKTSDLLFSVVTDTLPTSGATGDWASYLPAGQSYPAINGPTAEIIDGVKWEKNNRGTSDCGYTVGTYSADIPVNGITIVAAVKPAYNNPAIGGEPRGEIVDFFYSDLFLAVAHNTGEVIVNYRGYNAINTGYRIPDGQKTILSLVVQATGQLALYANGVRKWSLASGVDYTYLHPTWATNINIGRNAPDGWSAFNGNIGDVFVYKTALSATDRKQLEADVASKFGITIPVTHTIIATAGANGTINPGGDVEVIEGQDQTFAINAAFGYSVESVTVDGKLEATPATSYTFTNVVADHTLAATFVQLDPYATWVTYYSFLTEEDAAKTADPDGDGQNNLMESALDSDPLSAAASGRVRSQIENVDGENALLITLPVLAGTPGFTGATSRTATFGGVVYTIEGSNDLAAFDQVVTEVTPARSAGMPAFSGTGAWTYRTFRLAGAVPARGAAGFLRVRVVAAAP